MGGLCPGGTSQELAAKDEMAMSNQDKKAEAQARAEFENEVKLLLLGAGESGKSTFFKQMKILHSNGFTEEELAGYKDLVHSNAFDCMKVLIDGATKWEIAFDTKENEEAAEAVRAIGSCDPLTPELSGFISLLWQDTAIQTAFARANELQIYDSAQFLFDNWDRVGQTDYMPTVEDVLRVRARTTGLVENKFEYGGAKFRLVDVGGQRNERKKWVHCFENVTAILFFATLSEYNQVLFEDSSVNRMKEALTLFDEICNSPWFKNTSIILFLNKDDIFREKIKTIDLKCCFPEYEGGCDYDNASKFIKEKFLSLNRNKDKFVYVNMTTATDTNNIRLVFNAVKDTILSRAL